IAMGVGYVNTSNWTDIPYQERRMPQEVIIPDVAEQEAKEVEKRQGEDAVDRTNQLTTQALAVYKLRRYEEIRKELAGKNVLTRTEDVRLADLEAATRKNLPSPEDQTAVTRILEEAKKRAPAKEAENWGLLGLFGLKDSLVSIDNATRSNYTPYGLS